MVAASLEAFVASFVEEPAVVIPVVAFVAVVAVDQSEASSLADSLGVADAYPNSPRCRQVDQRCSKTTQA